MALLSLCLPAARFPSLVIWWPQNNSEGEKYSVDSVIGGLMFAAAKATTALAKAKNK